MKNPEIDAYAQEQLQKIEEASIDNLIRQSLAQNRLPLDVFPVIEPIFVMLHPMCANYHPEQGLHAHDFFELFYIYRGNATQYTKKGSVTLTTGDACLMNTDYSHGISIPDETSIVFNLLISKEVFNSSFLNLLSENDQFSRFFLASLFRNDEQGECIHFHLSPDSRLELLMESLLVEYIQHRPCCLAAMQCYLSLIFTELLREQIYIAEKEELKDTNFTEILAYISANLADITLNSLAAHFHYDTTYLSKLLKKYFGQTFSSLVGDMRLSRAAALLLNEDIGIDVIVEMLGYYDRSYFNRVFRKKYGGSPQSYRSKGFSPH